MSEETITVNQDQYWQLVRDSAFLDVLHCYGVEDWEGYDIVLELYQEQSEAKECS